MAEDELTEQKPRGSRGRRLGLIALKLLCVIAFFEVSLRVGTYFIYSRNPYYLFYGFQGAASQVSISPWSVYGGQYFKLPPHYELQGAAGQSHETAHINSQGFRGPDFEPEKPPGTFRVACFGGSSTFGFHNDDDQTYPHHLRGLFAADPATAHVEVLNAGFPYYNTATIRGLLEQEVVAFDPDLITLYCAYNDASWPLELTAVVRATTWLQEHSITVLVLKQTLLTDKRIYSLMGKLGLGSAQPGDVAEVDAEIERYAERMLANLEAILTFARERDMQVVLVLQPITVRKKNSTAGQGLTYEDEYRITREKLEAGEPLSDFEWRMLRHHRMVEVQRDLATREGLPLVNNIAIVDQDRSRLASWVHLTDEANQRLAEALRDTIAPLVPE